MLEASLLLVLAKQLIWQQNKVTKKTKEVCFFKKMSLTCFAFW